MSVNFNNYSMWTQKKYEDDWYEWCVFVDESFDIINSIKSVEYTLHPSFPDPVRLVQNKSSRFALFSAGWGGFSIKIRINYENGSSFSTSYFLRLEQDNWPRPQAKKLADGEMQRVYLSLFDAKYRWRKLETIIKSSSLTKDRVLHILGDLQQSGLVRKAYFLSIAGNEMWGATAVVGSSPQVDPS